MRIGVNLRPFRPEIMGGMGDCFRELMQELLKTDHEFSFFMAPWNFDSIDFSHGRYEKILVDENAGGKQLWADRVRRVLSALDSRSGGRLGRWSGRVRHSDRYTDWHSHPASRLNLDLWFCPFSALDPSPVPIPSVVTIPDVQHEAYPQFFPEAELNLRRAYFPATCSLSSVILTLSEFSKKEIVDRYGVAGSKVHIVYTGVSPRFFHADSRNDVAVRAKYGLPDRYLYFPANAWPHKNHQLLLIALRLLAASGRKVSPLVLSGAPLDSASELLRLARHLDLDVRHLGYLPYLDIPAIYRGARLLVFPSLFEGFGMPAIEAMAAGVPVAAANVTSLPEVTGDAALLFNPRKPDEIADAIDRLSNDEALRAEMIRRGRERACRFTWPECARRTLAGFEDAVRMHNVGATAPSVSIQGLMSDNWMRKEVVISVARADTRRLIVEGVSPVGGSPFGAQTVTLIAGRRTLHREQPVPSQPFQFACDLDSMRPPFQLRLRTARTFVPRDEGWNEDSRELSIRFTRLVVETETETISLTNG